MSLVVDAAGVTKRFDGKLVLQGVDLEVQRGRSTVLIGPSSSGKSVFLKCLLGLLEMDAGAVTYDGTDIAALDKRGVERLMSRVGVLFQRNALFDSLSVWENVAFTLINGQRMRRKAARAIAERTLASVGLEERVADLSPAELSGGMQKRVGLARAIAAEPELLVLDDPTAGLDPILTNAIVSLIRDAIRKTGMTALAVTSDMAVARKGFDRLAMMHEGRIVWHGEAGEIDQSDNPYLQQLIHQRADGPIQMRITE